jgi:hypothetical protein
MATDTQPTKEKLFSLNSNPVMRFKVWFVLEDCSDAEIDNPNGKTVVYSHNDSPAPQFTRPHAEFDRDFTELA